MATFVQATQPSSPNTDRYQVSSYAILFDTQFKACAQLHPGFVEAEVARQITIPVVVLCSKDETEEEWRPFRDSLQVPYRMNLYPDMVHGWMSARGDLEDEEVRRAFKQGYELVLEWFREHL